MKTWLLALLLIAPAALLMPPSAAGFDGYPRCTALDPDTAKTGDTVNLTCANADKSTVADFYLTDGKDDTRIAVAQYDGDKVKIQVPKIKPGRYHVAILTANKASMIEQPVALTVE